MVNIQLNNGQSVIIGSNRDIIDVIGEHCSYELASLVSEKMVVIDAEKCTQKNELPRMRITILEVWNQFIRQ